ncbi:hypothetical protein DL546_009791 [Coniochaeta pulveracea]|uniref:Uncharacterized protein n=1 Tax=Coniochaeta pulveracea TaxID=177199 RepID=A0A420YNA9_9PEZI|nr:hypothetical protein DL546_009791 [Coniochaeta pulveracea]
MATLTPEFLTIQDSYTSVSTPSTRHPPSKPILGRANTLTAPHRHSPLRPTSVRSLSMNAASDYDSDGNACVPEPQAEQTAHPVDSATRLLISVTAVWIALQGGWSPYYTPPADHGSNVESPVGSATTSPSSRLGRRGTRSRGNSIDIANMPHHGHPRSPLSATLHSREHSPVRNFCSGSHLPPWWETRTTSSPVVPTALLPPPAVRSPTPDLSGIQPRRATSTGAAFMQRSRIASVNRAAEDDSDPEHTKQRGRCLSSGGQRTTARHSVGATPTTPVQKAVLEAGPNVHPARRERSYQVNINTRLDDQPPAHRQRDSSGGAKHIPPGSQPSMALPGLDPIPALPGTVTSAQAKRRPFGTKVKDWFRKLGTHSH